MVMVTINGVERYYDGYMVQNLDQLKRAVELKWDGVLLYTGYEGDGKTTKCSQDMLYLDHTFDLSRVCFTLEQIEELVEKLLPGSALQYDESWKDTSNLAGRESQQRLIRLMTEKRKKRLYWGIVSATFFDLRKYFVIHRTRALLNIYSSDLRRGFFSFYDRDRKKNLYIKGKRDWDWNVEKPNFRGRFTDWLPFDTEEYEAKKDASTKISDENANGLFESREGKQYIIKQQLAIVEYLKRNQWINKKGPLDTSLATFLHVSPRTLTNYRKDLVFAHENGLLRGDVPLFEPQKHPENNEYALQRENDDLLGEDEA